MPHVQGQRRNPSKTVAGAKSSLESNPIPASDVRRSQINLDKPLLLGWLGESRKIIYERNVLSKLKHETVKTQNEIKFKYILPRGRP